MDAAAEEGDPGELQRRDTLARQTTSDGAWPERHQRSVHKLYLVYLTLAGKEPRVGS